MIYSIHHFLNSANAGFRKFATKTDLTQTNLFIQFSLSLHYAAVQRQRRQIACVGS